VLKRDDLGFPTFWTVQIGGWICLYLWGLLSLIPVVHQPGAVRGNTVFTIVLFVTSSLYRQVCRSLMRHGYGWIALEIRAFAWCLAGGLISSYIVEIATFPHPPFNWTDWVQTFAQAAFMLFVWCSLYFSIKMWQQSLRERERLLRAQAEVRDVRLSALRYQLNPHFLFNSLNAVSTLVLEDNPPVATRMLAQIGDFLRTILDTEAEPETPLSQEIAFAEQYLAIEQTRLGPRLRVEMAIAPETLDALVPSMLLQPLIENAVRHGVAPVVEGGTIHIESKLDGGRVRIGVRNSGPRAGGLASPNHPASGIGIHNTAERLRTLYGAEHTFELQWPEAGGCEVTIELPFRKNPQPEGAASCAR
jgi:two-component system, LytTR family, sensor kinase